MCLGVCIIGVGREKEREREREIERERERERERGGGEGRKKMASVILMCHGSKQRPFRRRLKL